MEKIRKGEKAVQDKHRTSELKQASKDFYKQASSHICCCPIGVHSLAAHVATVTCQDRARVLHMVVSKSCGQA